MDTWELVDAERKDNIAMLEGLTPDQWDEPSLCDGWKVRDVAAHLSSPAAYEILAFLGEMLRAGFNVNTATRRDAVKRGAVPPEQLIQQYRDTIGMRRKPPGTSAETLLNDMVVHGQDIRRPLGLGREIPGERVRTCLDYIVGTNLAVGGKKRAAGVHLVATDLDWTHGDGPEVRGTGEALLMVLNGRKDALKDLEGPGAETLTARM